MNRTELLNKIAEYLARFSAEVEIHNKTNEYDINIHSEDVLIPLLNFIFEINLVNANRITRNYPAIDLIDTENRVAFQVTSTDSSQKINGTLKKFIEHNLNERIDVLYIYILKSGELKGKANEELSNKASFSKNSLLSNSRIYELIKSLPLSKIQRIHKLLEDEFSDIKIEIRKRKGIEDNGDDSELVFPNLLEIEFPEKIFIAQISKTDEEILNELGWKRKRKGKITRRRLLKIYLKNIFDSPEIPSDWIYYEDKIISFRDFSKSEMFLSIVDQGTILEENSIDIAKTIEKPFKFLLRLSFIQRVRSIGLEWTDEERVIRFRSGEVPLEKSISWKLGSKSQPRSVINEIWSKDEENKHIVCFRHLAFKFLFYSFDDVWYISILPTYSFTSNGIRKSRFSLYYMSGIKRLEDNQSVYYHFRFLAYYISKINREDNLLVENQAWPYKLEIKDPVGLNFSPAIIDDKWNPPKKKVAKENKDQLNLFK